ncbi:MULTISPECIES: VOC family protein [Micromonospora]|uniref:Catechol 2,3-dioxygenase n=1 Tax=Micromonospora yangpuensis TaxID=683228 RepID=A0A1C6UUB7_9ACTN|nr:VOC family protein [Micromonospora yangpuensis]GGM24185.1 glyoxalase [Micromonospora yangpuensis]SCL57642.1 Catechol 2,3-dioxygenase [Micromonospora yangpuensis]
MITSVGSVIIFVTDQQKALDFYTDTLGFEVRLDVTVPADQAPEVDSAVRWIEVAAPSTPTTLSLISRQFAQLRPGKGCGEFTDVNLLVDDMKATYEELNRKGVRFRVEPQHDPFGWRAEFVDPDGNGFNLIETAAGYRAM